LTALPTSSADLFTPSLPPGRTPTAPFPAPIADHDGLPTDVDRPEAAARLILEEHIRRIAVGGRLRVSADKAADLDSPGPSAAAIALCAILADALGGLNRRPLSRLCRLVRIVV
jgi:hypothetical protein